MTGASGADIANREERARLPSCTNAATRAPKRFHRSQKDTRSDRHNKATMAMRAALSRAVEEPESFCEHRRAPARPLLDPEVQGASPRAISGETANLSEIGLAETDPRSGGHTMPDEQE